MKVCNKCKIKKSLEDFHKKSSNKDGHKNTCKECSKKYHKEWYEKNIDKRRKQVKEYMKNNNESVKSKQKEYRKNNRDKENARHKKYRENNIERYKQKNNEYKKKQYHNNTQYRIKQNVARRIRQCIHKEKGTVEYLGCDIKFYKEYLESLFVEEMSWDNYGKWEIDHKIPLSSFDFNAEKQVLEAFNYKNTQPLWAEENRKKSGKLM